jgi:ABC-type oligopeptide transport system ATPase subunit
MKRLEVKSLGVRYPSGGLASLLGMSSPESQHEFAVRDFSASFQPGKCYGLIGESGCGKTSVAKAIAVLNHAHISGTVTLEGDDVHELDRTRSHELRQKLQYIFQHADTFINPRLRAIQMISEAIELMGTKPKSEEDVLAYPGVQELLDILGLSRFHLLKSPHMLSGGERKRIGILRCLLVQPEWLIADEPFAGLDLSYRNKVLKLFKDLIAKGLCLIIISHDFNVIRQVCDHVIVMYRGLIVDEFQNKDLEYSSLHPYTQALIESMDSLPHASRELPESLEYFSSQGAAGSWQASCAYANRCHVYRSDESEHFSCSQKYPELRRVDEVRRLRCHVR